MVFTYATTVFLQNTKQRLYSINSVMWKNGRWKEGSKEVTYKHMPKDHKLVAPYESLMWES